MAQRALDDGQSKATDAHPASSNDVSIANDATKTANRVSEAPSAIQADPSPALPEEVAVPTVATRLPPRSPSLSALPSSFRRRLQCGLSESLLTQLAFTWTSTCWALAECDVDEARWGDVAVEGIDMGELGWGVCLRRGPPGLRVDGDGIVEREMARRSARARALEAAAERLTTPEVCEVKAQIRAACGEAIAAAFQDAERALLEAFKEALVDEEAFKAASPEDPRSADRRHHAAPIDLGATLAAAGSHSAVCSNARSARIESDTGFVAVGNLGSASNNPQGSHPAGDASGRGERVEGAVAAAGQRDSDTNAHAASTSLHRVLQLALEEAGAEAYVGGAHPNASGSKGFNAPLVAATAETYFRGVVIVPLLVALRGSDPRTLRASVAAFGRAGRAVAGDLASVAATTACKDLRGTLERCLLGCDAWMQAVESEHARWAWTGRKRGRRGGLTKVASGAGMRSSALAGELASSTAHRDGTAVASTVRNSGIVSDLVSTVRQEDGLLSGASTRNSLGLCFCPAAHDAALAAPKRLRRRCAELSRALADVCAAEAAVEALARAAPAPARATALERCRRALDDIRAAARKGPFLNVGEALNAVVDPHRVEGVGESSLESATWGATWGAVWRNVRGDGARFSSASASYQKVFQSDFPSSTTRYRDDDLASVALTRRTQLTPARAGAASDGRDVQTSAKRLDLFPQGLAVFESVLKSSCREIAAAIGPVLAACPDADATRHLARRLGAARRLPGIDAVIESIREGQDEDGARSGAASGGGGGTAALAAALRAAKRGGASNGGPTVALRINLASVVHSLHSYGGAWQLQRQVADAQLALALLSSGSAQRPHGKGAGEDASEQPKGAAKPNAVAARMHASLAASHPGPPPSTFPVTSAFSFAPVPQPPPTRTGRTPPQPVFWRPPGTNALLPSIPSALWNACAFGDLGAGRGLAGQGGRRVSGASPLPSMLAQSVSPARLAELADLYARAARVALAIERAGPPSDPAQMAAREAALSRGLGGGVTWEGAPQTIMAYLTGIEEALR